VVVAGVGGFIGLDRAADQLAGRVGVVTRADHELCSVGQHVSDVAGCHPGGRGAEGPRRRLRLEGDQGRFTGARRAGGDEDRERGLVAAARAAVDASHRFACQADMPPVEAPRLSVAVGQEEVAEDPAI
jgi:hypothetical protein